MKMQNGTQNNEKIYVDNDQTKALMQIKSSCISVKIKQFTKCAFSELCS